MATDENIALVSDQITTVGLEASVAFIIQNTLTYPVKFKVKDSAADGGTFEAGSTKEFNYDIDIWNPHGKPNETVNLYLVRA